jgi:hypothetical protein
VHLDDSFAASVRPTLQSLADDVWDLIGMMFHNAPPLDLPISCRYEKADGPLTAVKDDVISIRLTSTGTYYAQFAFQLAHELGHVMLDPRRSNGVVETICTAVSYEVLDRLGDRVTLSPRLSWVTDYAPHFREYRAADEKSYLTSFPEDVRAMVSDQRWSDLSAYLAAHRADMEPRADRERATQSLAAIALRSAPLDWGQFTGLAGCTTPDPSERPRFRIAAINPDCIDRLGSVLCRMGWGCGN